MADSKARANLKQTWIERARKLLAGRTIADVRWLTDAEAKRRGWRATCPVLILDDGTTLIPSVDDEGNQAGVLQVYQSGNFVEVLCHI